MKLEDSGMSLFIEISVKVVTCVKEKIASFFNCL